MEDYTVQDVVDAIKLIDPNNRKRVLVDQRSYLIGLLAYKFDLSEHTIAGLINYKRDKVNYNKKLVIQWHTDSIYKQNVYVHTTMFPFDFSPFKSGKTARQVRIVLDIDQKFFNKLKKYGDVSNQKDIRLTIKDMLTKVIKLWEE
jgi:hypothetical protein